MPRFRSMLLVPAAVVPALLAIVVGEAVPAQNMASPRVANAHAGDPYALMVDQSTDLGAVAPGLRVSLVLGLKDPHAKSRAADYAAINTPHSGQFGQSLTSAQVAARYGPSPATMARVTTVLKRYGLSAQWQPGNTWAVITGPARAVESAFGVNVHWYRSSQGVHYFSADRVPVLPPALSDVATGLSRISSYFPQPRQSVPSGGVTPTDLVSAYNMAPLRNMGLDGTGSTVAFLESDGGWNQQDFDTFTQKFNLPPLHPVLASGPSGKPPDGETEMDLEVVHEIAPGARLVVYNFPFQEEAQAATSDSATLTDWLKLQTQMLNDNKGGVLSMSMGLCEKIWDPTLAKAYKDAYDNTTPFRESVFVSTGDSAAYSCIITAPKRGTPPAPDYLGAELPSAVPGVTAVGGTRLSLTTDHAWYDETVWEYPVSTNGTGGGVSAYYSMPTWQKGNGVLNAQLNPKNMREVPDVSADADVASGAATYYGDSSGGHWDEGGGTSQSAPIWAAMTVLINQYLQKQGLRPAGFLNPALYQIAASDPNAFHDVTVGTNLYYPATPGYDMATGLGTPNAWNLAQDLAAYQRSGGQ